MTFVGGHRDEMHMIRNQTVSPDFRLRFVSRLAHQIKVQRVVRVFKENSIPPIATLGDVVRVAGNNDSRKACHAERVACFVYLVNCHRSLEFLAVSELQP
jgi:hypothetical protein